MTFRRITLPLIAPGIFAGAFLAFFASVHCRVSGLSRPWIVGSVDNVPVSLFLSCARTDMLPIRIGGWLTGLTRQMGFE